MKFLIVVDMQNDFIDGALGTEEAVKILPKVADKVKQFDGEVIFTRDTHYENYSETQEGKNLPVPHCIYGSKGWEIHDCLKEYVKRSPVDKKSFGSIELAEKVREIADKSEIDSITLVGLCTDICVISNAMILKASFPETKLTVDASCCAGVTVESHKNALEAMKMCQIEIM